VQPVSADEGICGAPTEGAWHATGTVPAMPPFLCQWYPLSEAQTTHSFWTPLSKQAKRTQAAASRHRNKYSWTHTPKQYNASARYSCGRRTKLPLTTKLGYHIIESQKKKSPSILVSEAQTTHSFLDSLTETGRVGQSPKEHCPLIV